MGVKQKVLVGTLVGGTACVLVGSLLVFPPMIIIGGIAVGLSLRKRLLFKKKKPKKEERKKTEPEPGQAPEQEQFIKKAKSGQLTTGKIDGTSIFYPAY